MEEILVVEWLLRSLAWLVITRGRLSKPRECSQFGDSGSQLKLMSPFNWVYKLEVVEIES